jgi:hypothetical protein
MDEFFISLFKYIRLAWIELSVYSFDDVIAF